jgi:hypothetical protein
VVEVIQQRGSEAAKRGRRRRKRRERNERESFRPGRKKKFGGDVRGSELRRSPLLFTFTPLQERVYRISRGEKQR